MESEKVRCTVCGAELEVRDFNFYGYVRGEPICYPCYEDLSFYFDAGFKPSEVRDRKEFEKEKGGRQ